MNDKIIWDYIKNKSLEELTRYSLDVATLYRAIRKDIIVPRKLKLDHQKLTHQLKNIVALASYLVNKLSSLNLDKVTPDELEDMLPTLSIAERLFLIQTPESKNLYQELKAHEDFKIFGLSEQAFIVNQQTAKVLFSSCMNQTISKNPKKLHTIHAIFEELRQELSTPDHVKFFGVNPNAKGPFTLRNPQLLNELLDSLFKSKNSPYTLLSHRQLWLLSQEFTSDENLALFGKKSINRKDDINLSNINWHELIRIAKQYNIHLRLEKFQYRRYVQHLTLEQGMDLADMILNKASGFGENSLQGGSQWLAAYGLNAGPMMKLFTSMMGGLVNGSLFLQRALYMPVVAALGLVSAKRNYDAEVDFEDKIRKKTILDFIRTNKLKKRISTQSEQLKTLSAQFPEDATPYLHNGQPCYYLILKSWLIKNNLIIPNNILAIEEKFLRKGHDRELLFYLTQALILSPNAVTIRPILKTFVDRVKDEIPNFTAPKSHSIALSPYNPNNQENISPIGKLRFAKTKDRVKKISNSINPYITPTVSAISAGSVLFCIAWMLTTTTSYLIAAGVASALIGGLVWVIRYKSERKKEKLESIHHKSHTVYHRTRNEIEYLTQHKQLCEIINDLSSAQDPTAQAKRTQQLAQKVVQQENQLQEQARLIDELQRKIANAEVHVSNHPRAFFNRSDEPDEHVAVGDEIELSPANRSTITSNRTLDHTN